MVIAKTKKTKSKSKIQAYNRKEWIHWIDTDRDCQNTRHELLIERSLTPVRFKPNKKGKNCLVKRGKWIGEFSGQVFQFAGEVEIDHAISLKWAHTHGGFHWTKEQKKEFANDPENLLIVAKRLNRSKGARAPWEWMPMNKKLACKYQAKWNNLIKKYKFKISSKEYTLLQSAVTGC